MEIRKEHALKTVITFLIATPSAMLSAETPYIDAVVEQIRPLAPGSEGYLWQQSSGNELPSNRWLQQTPNCWGDADPETCTGAESIGALADSMEEIIASAEQWVDITTLMPWADGQFYDAIVEGIKLAYDTNNDTIFRLLAGRYPLSGDTEEFYQKLLNDLGEVPNIKLFVAGMSTSRYPSFPLVPDSWNHSKIVASDAKIAMVGGINYWSIDYAEGPDELPVNDVNMILSGPAAYDAHHFSDLMWDFTCNNYDDTSLVHLYATTDITEYCPSQHTNSKPLPSGDVDVLMIAGAGMGIEVPGGSEGGLPNVDDPMALCNENLGDYTNYNSEYTVLNPADHALRVLMSAAQEHVFLSQQDVILGCNALPNTVTNSYYDSRHFDVIANKLIEGIKFTIVVSTPQAQRDYSYMEEMTEITDVLLRKIEQQIGDPELAEATVCNNLQLGHISFEHGLDTWPLPDPNNKFANHAKVLSVDSRAFYIGSKNIYPSPLQDFGYIVENPTAAQEFEASYINNVWDNSKHTAIVDFEQDICEL